MEISKNIVSKKDLQNAAHKENWDQLWVILVAHCINRLINRYGIKTNKDDLVNQANQKISEVLSLVLIEGTRRWNTEEYPTFKDFMVSVIDSHLNNTFNKSKAIEEYRDILPEKSIDSGHDMNISYDEQRKEAYQFLSAEGASDDELMIFECMADGIVKPKAIKADLGISDSDFHNAWRRLKVKLKKLRNKLSEQ